MVPENAKGSVPSLQSSLDSSFEYGTSNFDDNLKKSQPHKAILLGYPIAASFAPLIHNTLFSEGSLPWKYELLESKDRQDLLDLLPDEHLIGAAVTMPHKVTFSVHTDALTAEAKATGAINTIFFRRDAQGRRRCIGTNTDTIGVREAFLRNVSASHLERGSRSPALVIGGGGAARAAIYALHIWLGVEEIYMVNRFASEVEDIRQAFSAHGSWTARITHVEEPSTVASLETPFLVVSTVPDYPAESDDEKKAQAVTKAFLDKTREAIALEMCYMPKVVTSFYTLAEQAGWTVVPGTQATIWQGIAQQVLWTEDTKVTEPEFYEAGNHAIMVRMKELEDKSSK